MRTRQNGLNTAIDGRSHNGLGYRPAWSHWVVFLIGTLSAMACQLESRGSDAEKSDEPWVTEAYRKSCIEKWLSDDLAKEARMLSYKDRTGKTEGWEEEEARQDQMKMALLRAYTWKPGRTLNVRFMDGTPKQKILVRDHVKKWEKYANINFVFGDSPNAEIRISFRHDPGSWSFIGTMALVADKKEPTMNFGWLRDDTDETEANRVVLHEFGHCLGAIHEHQHPNAGIPWNKERVYKFYGGPPNNWPRPVVDRNLFDRFDRSQTLTGTFDPKSIMMYPIALELTDGKFQVGLNGDLSTTDKWFIRQCYPGRPISK